MQVGILGLCDEAVDAVERHVSIIDVVAALETYPRHLAITGRSYKSPPLPPTLAYIPPS